MELNTYSFFFVHFPDHLLSHSFHKHCHSISSWPRKIHATPFKSLGYCPGHLCLSFSHQEVLRLEHVHGLYCGYSMLEYQDRPFDGLDKDLIGIVVFHNARDGLATWDLTGELLYVRSVTSIAFCLDNVILRFLSRSSMRATSARPCRVLLHFSKWSCHITDFEKRD